MSQERHAWRRAPVALVGALILIATVAGCVAMIALALRHADVAVDTGVAHVMKVPPRHAAGQDP